MSAEQDLNMAVKGYGMAMQGVTMLSDVMSTVIKHLQRDPAVKLLNKEVGGGDLGTMFVHPSQVGELSERLTNAGISNVCTKYGPDKSGVIVFSHKSASDVEDIARNLYNEKRVTPFLKEDTLLKTTDRPLQVIKNLSTAEATLFAQHAKSIGAENGFGISIAKNGENYNLFYRKEDQELMRDIKATVALESSGRVGEYLAKDAIYKDGVTKDIMRAAETTKSAMYVVNRKTCDLEESFSMNRGSLAYTENEKKVVVSERDSLESTAIVLMSKIEQPVLLTSEEFQKYKEISDKGKRDSYLKEIELAKGKPSMDKELANEFEKMDEMKSLYEQKLSEGSDVPVRVIEFSYTNDEMKMAEFMEVQAVNQTAFQDNLSAEQEEIVNKAIDQFYGFEDEESVFVLESELEEISRESELEKSLLMEQETFVDHNHNGTPDVIDILDDY